MTSPAPAPAWTVLDSVLDLVAKLQAAGIRTTWDLDELNPPCIYVQLPVVRWQFQAGTYAADHTVYAVSRNTKREHAVTELADLMVRVQNVLAGRIVTGRPVDVTSPDATRQLPAYELTWTDSTKRRPPATEKE